MNKKKEILFSFLGISLIIWFLLKIYNKIESFILLIKIIEKPNLLIWDNIFLFIILIVFLYICFKSPDIKINFKKLAKDWLFIAGVLFIFISWGSQNYYHNNFINSKINYEQNIQRDSQFFNLKGGLLNLKNDFDYVKMKNKSLYINHNNNYKNELNKEAINIDLKYLNNYKTLYEILIEILVKANIDIKDLNNKIEILNNKIKYASITKEGKEIQEAYNYIETIDNIILKKNYDDILEKRYENIKSKEKLSSIIFLHLYILGSILIALYSIKEKYLKKV